MIRGIEIQFKDNLKHLRKEKGISQEQLSELVGIACSTIAGYEQGWLNPSQKVLVKNYQSCLM